MTPDERKQFVEDVACAIRSSTPPLSDDELQWVRLAIEKEAQSIRLRQAVIEKSLSGLIWSGIVGFGYLIVDWFKNHGLRI